MVQLTKDVFTPAKRPTVTGVNRENLSKEIDRELRRGGFFISVLGTTKLGKTTLVNAALKKLDYSIFLNGHSLSDGVEAIWQKLGADLEIPVSKETGMVSGDKSTWGFFAKFSATLGLLKGEGGSQMGGEHMTQTNRTNAVQLDAEAEVIKAFELLVQKGMTVAIAIDDFHFITDVEKRRSLIKALRPIAFVGVSIVLITLPNRETDAAFTNTNIGGRHRPITVPTWSKQDLGRIASQGFEALNVFAGEDIVDKLVTESFGSPQIMQQLCLNLCEDINEVLRAFPGPIPYLLEEPGWWPDFFTAVRDHQSEQWLQILINGPKQRRHERKTYKLGSYQKFDGYQLIFFVLRDKGAPPSVAFSEIKDAIGLLLYPQKDDSGRRSFDSKKVNAMNLDAKANNMHVLAHKILENLKAVEASAELSDDDNVFDEESIEIAGNVPQPVFEFIKDPVTPLLNILDPQLCYTLKWHSEKQLG